jgi:hypothetical protein
LQGCGSALAAGGVFFVHQGEKQSSKAAARQGDRCSGERQMWQGGPMANLDTEQFGTDIAAVRRAVRRSAHSEHMRTMLMAATLSAFGMVAVAATLLTNLI